VRGPIPARGNQAPTSRSTLEAPVPHHSSPAPSQLDNALNRSPSRKEHDTNTSITRRNATVRKLGVHPRYRNQHGSLERPQPPAELSIAEAYHRSPGKDHDSIVRALMHVCMRSAPAAIPRRDPTRLPLALKGTQHHAQPQPQHTTPTVTKLSPLSHWKSLVAASHTQPLLQTRRRASHTHI